MIGDGFNLHVLYYMPDGKLSIQPLFRVSDANDHEPEPITNEIIEYLQHLDLAIYSRPTTQSSRHIARRFLSGVPWHKQ